MAPSFMKKTMMYLGLVDDEYEDYDDYEDRNGRGYGAVTRPEPRSAEPVEPPPPAAAAPSPLGRIRTLPREGPGPTPTASAAPQPQSAGRPNMAPVRPVSPDAAVKVQVVAPKQFNAAKHIADHLKANRPVIVNLQIADRDLQRRMIDFCSGVTYALSGAMDKVADEVFLLTPANVKVSDEERQRLQERGLVRP